MIIPLFASFLVGAFGVFQNTFNKQIGSSLGLPLTLVANASVLLCASIALFFALRFFPEAQIAEIYREKNSFRFPWQAIIPGLFGFFIVATAPWAIGRIGATRVFIAIIVAQILVSVLWDHFAEATPVSASRLAGAALALAGALLAVR